MTARAATLGSPSFGELARSFLRGPVEGWLSLVAVVVMVDVLALALINSGWTGAVGSSTFLPWLAVGGVLFGAGATKVGWGRWRTFVIGALFGGLLIPLIVGGTLLHPEPGWDPGSLALRMYRSFEIIRKVWTDLVVHLQQQTSEYGYYLLLFGALVWGGGLLAGFGVFGHRRPLDVTITLGLVLLANIFITGHDQLVYLEVYAAAALLLLIRSHVFEEELTWTRRKIGDPAAVSGLYLNGGALFVTLTLIGAIVLTTFASSAPLAGVFQDLPSRLQAVSAWLQRFAPPGGDFAGIGGVYFGNNAVTTGLWTPNGKTAFRVQVPRAEGKEKFKWRAGTYAEYTNFGWTWGGTRTEPTAAGATVLGDDVTGDAPIATGRRELRLRVTLDAFVTNTILSPNTVQSVDRPTNAFVVGEDGWFASLEATDSGGIYNVTALVPDYTDATGITEPNLRTAGTDYPEELLAIYTALPQGAMGTNADLLMKAIKAQVRAPAYADPNNPFDLAKTMQDYLRNPANFTYDADVRDEKVGRCGDVSTVECFAIIQKGYCDYYASTMAVLLRSQGVPARVAYGFLPGSRAADGTETVVASLAHYWVEVYFPHYGWIEFDPTGGQVGQVQAIPTGEPPAATPSPSVGPSRSPGATGGPAGTQRPVTGSTNPGAGIGPFIAITLILGIGVLLLAFAVARRAPRKPMHPDQAWGSLARLAGRIGLAPRPSQTVYEYAGALGDAVPDARIELTTIARAKVEVAYGRRDLGSDRLKRIAEAYQRLRFALLGVILRRGIRLGRASRSQRRR